MFKKYYRLSKPGIIYGNVLSLIAGYLLVALTDIDVLLFVSLVIGTSLVIAGACAWNNYLDRGIDEKMARTAKRALVTGDIAPWPARIYASSVFIIGMVVLLLTQNWVTALLALVAFVDYVLIYTPVKHRSTHGTLLGTISGSIPLTMGYTAVVGRIDIAAILLFLLMAAWQMAHFWGIALYRLKDYTAAGVPVLPVVKGVPRTVLYTRIWIWLFVACAIGLIAYGTLNIVAGVVLVAWGLWWLWSASVTRKLPSEAWGKLIFKQSLLVMLALCVCLTFGGL